MITNRLILPMKERTNSFSHAIEEGGKRTTFHFEPVFMIDKIKFLVTVSDTLQQNCFFYMEKTHSGWKIINAPQIPDKYLKQEQALATAILANTDN
jgi:hypothetical protein